MSTPVRPSRLVIAIIASVAFTVIFSVAAVVSADGKNAKHLESFNKYLSLELIYLSASTAPECAPVAGPALFAGSVDLSSLGVTYTQNFNTLAIAASSTLPTGWAFSEAGNHADTTYAGGTGSSATGDTYSFGATVAADRAFGGLRTGTLIPTIGASFTNNTLSTITSLAISFYGEQWRLGALSRIDRLDFQYSTDATSLTTGTWTDVDTLDFTAPLTSGTVGAIDGNVAANRTAVSSSINGLNIGNGSAVWIRWNDLDAAGSDDGLAIDDFSLTPSGGAPTATPTSTPTATPTPTPSPTYTLTYTAGSGGTIVGINPQTGVEHGSNGSLVTATPAANYHFASWSDGYPTAARTDMNVMADINATANFAINQYTLTYTAGAGGSISGTSPQTVNHGEDGSAVTAVPGSGYDFVDWSDNSTENPRTDTNVMDDISVTANFAESECHTLSVPASIDSISDVDVAIPVSITNTTGAGIESIDFAFSYNPLVMVPITFPDPEDEDANLVSTSPGEVTGLANIIAVQPAGEPGVIRVSMYGTGPLEGEGTLVYINMHVIGTAGSMTTGSSSMTLSEDLLTGGLQCSDVGAPGTLTVLNTPTVTNVTAAPNPSVYGSSVTITAAAKVDEVAVATGTITFIEGGTCSSPIATLSGPTPVDGSGEAAFMTSSLTAGSHTIKACYSGATNLGPSEGSVLQVVSQLSVSPSVSAGSKTYDGTTAAAISTCTIPGKIGMDDVACTATGPNSFDNRNAGTGKTVTATNISLTGSDADNYVLSSTTAATIADISQLEIVITAVTDTKAYDGSTSSSGMPTVVPSVPSPDSGTFSQAFDDRNAGTGKTLIPSGSISDGNGGNNYTRTFVTVTTGVINPLSITVAAVIDTKTYDGSSSSSGSPTVVPSLVSPDSGMFSQVFDNRNAGTGKILTPTGSISDDNGGNNYTVTFAPVSTGVINALPIIVTALTDTKTYDGSPSSSASPNISPALISPDLSGFVQAFNNRNAGTGKTLTPSGLAIDGNGGDNYAVTFAPVSTGVINALPIIVTALTDTKTYDGSTSSAGSPTVTPSLIGPDSGIFSQAFDNRNAGTGKTLTPSGSISDGNGGNNYTLTFAPVSTGVINPLAVSVTAVADSKIYDGTASSAGTPSVAPALIVPDFGTFSQVFDTPNAGIGKTLTPSGSISDGNGGNNYSVSFVPITNGSITKATLIVTPDPQTVFYGTADPEFTFEYTGFVAGEDEDDLTTQAVCSVPGPSPHDPAVYTITCDEGTAVNYNFDVTATAVFTVHTGTITGAITYALAPATVPVPQVTLDSPGSVNVSDDTDSVGAYSLSGFGGGAYTVTPSKPAQSCGPMLGNGVFANDAGLVARHVVHLITLSPEQLLAAKVSGTLTPVLSSFDASLIAQKVVGICTASNLAGHWRFTPASVAHEDGIIMNYTEDYTAYMMGDVNGDWSPTGPLRPIRYDSPTRDAVVASVPRMTAAAGDGILVPFRIDNLAGKAVDSYQLDIAYDPSVVTPAQIAADLAGTVSEGLSVVFNSPEPGLLKVAVYGTIPTSGDGVYVNLRFTVTGPAGSRTPLTIAGFRFNDGRDEITTADGQIVVLKKEW